MEGMQDYYSTSEEVLIGWDEDDHCACQLNCDDRWYRAKILSRPNEHQAEVQATDYGYQVKMRNTHVHKYTLSHTFSHTCN